MSTELHKVFISYHHHNDQVYKEALLRINRQYGLFLDWSVNTGDIDDNLDDQTIRRIIRDEYLRESTVTILLVGTETRRRKHIDWELYSSMFDGALNKKSGILVINLPATGCTYYNASHGDEEKSTVYPQEHNWITIGTRSEYEALYPYMPPRVIDQLVHPGARVSVTNWEIIMGNIFRLSFLIEVAFRDRAVCDYDLSRPMRRYDS